MYDEIVVANPAKVTGMLRKRSREEGIPEQTAERVATKVYCTTFDSRIGRIYVASTERGVCKISVPRETRKDFFTWLDEHLDIDGVVDNKSRNKEIIDQLSRYLSGRLVRFTCPVDLIGTPFQLRVWNELMKVAYGSTVTYKTLAKRVSVPSAFQAVGRANAANPLPILVPCHRILGSDGSMVGYAYGIKMKEFLLRLEGAIIL